MKLSVVICTYNRSAILKECLDSLVEFPGPLDQYEVLVINNNSTDETQSILETFTTKIPNFKVVVEERQGLSHARNRAIREAAGDWLLYIDDDAKVIDSTIRKTLGAIDHAGYQFFGGNPLPWFKYGRPRWYKTAYAVYENLPYKENVVLTGSEYVTGCIMVGEKELFKKYDGFHPNLGMIGKDVGFGEETEFQERIRKEGIETGYVPGLTIKHLVPKYKLKVDWFFKSAFALGRDKIKGEMTNASTWNLFLIFLTGFAQTFVYLLIYTPQLIREGYFIENWLIDVFRKFAKRIGMIYTALLNR